MKRAGTGSDPTQFRRAGTGSDPTQFGQAGTGSEGQGQEGRGGEGQGRHNATDASCVRTRSHPRPRAAPIKNNT